MWVLMDTTQIKMGLCCYWYLEAEKLFHYCLLAKLFNKGKKKKKPKNKQNLTENKCYLFTHKNY